MTKVTAYRGIVDSPKPKGDSKIALITGITGQDGAYLAEFLLNRGYLVHGIRRRTSMFNTGRIDHLYRDPHEAGVRLFLHHGDLTDSSNLVRIIEQVQPDEIYNLAAQSHVAVSFEQPEYTANSDALGVLRLLEAIRILRLEKRTRFYQASTSELYGLVQEVPQKEATPFYPRSPYGVAKLYGHWITVNYREAYGIYACNGILFNHESPIRGELFVTRKITRALARIRLGLHECLYLGNLSAKRDWGHAKDYVEAQWLMLQQDKPEDFVIATGQQHSVREFVNAAAEELRMKIRWEGEGVDEVGILDEVNPWLGVENDQRYAGRVLSTPSLQERTEDSRSNAARIVVRVDPRYFRPTEVETLLGDASKARSKLGWSPKISFRELVREMVLKDLEKAERDQLVKKHGYSAYDYHE